ncbi:MAG: mandelate racemase/muconate lactonizing enzyme family protein [Armatimonadota bacterium]
MKITDVLTTILPTGSVFVRVRTDAGITGIGECSPMGPSVIAAVVHDVLRPKLIGADPFDTEPLWDRMMLEPYKLGPHGALPEAVAGVDIALWDIKGKATGMPVCKLLGGMYRDRVRVYYSWGWDGRASPLEVARLMAAKVHEGYTAVKVRMGWSPLHTDSCDDPGLAMVRELRSALGEEVDILYDANNGYTPHRAIRMGRELEGLNVFHFEEPVAQYDYHGLAQVADALDMPVAAGEHEYTRWHFRDLITQGRVDILQPDVVKCGGLTEAKRIAALCQAFNKPITVHNTQPTIGTAASLHFAASTANCVYPQEYTGRRPELARLFRSEIEFRDGCLMVPTAPGIGLEVDEAALDAEGHTL